MKKLSLLIVLLVPVFVFAQSCDKVNKKMVKRLQADIETLASDQMEGREPGTTGEIKARDYLVKRMKEIGLSPKGSDGYIQAFSYLEKVKRNLNKINLSLNDKTLQLNHQYYPTELSANGNISDVPVLSVAHGIHLPQEGYSDYERLDIEINGYIALMDIAKPSALKVAPDLLTRAIEALDRGAVALLLYSSAKGNHIPPSSFRKISSIGIPVIFLKNKAFEAVPADYIENASISVAQYEAPTKAHNVIGYIDNGAENTVAIMGHYDHLGYGGEGSHYKGPRKIHNGADDNASGTAAILELAYFFQNNKIKENNNFLFIAFSAEEKGLIGSNYYVQNPTHALTKINYVINIDMIGRMEDNMALTIEGTGSSLVWEASLKEIECDAFPLNLKKRENGPSDHKAFYYSGIPALHFWTGKHNDYHRPTDDVEKINFEAESRIISFIQELIITMDSKGKLAYHLRE